MKWLGFGHEGAVCIGAVIPSVFVDLLAILGGEATIDLVQALKHLLLSAREPRHAGVGHEQSLVELDILLLVHAELLLELNQLFLRHMHSKEGPRLLKELMLRLQSLDLLLLSLDLCLQKLILSVHHRQMLEALPATIQVCWLRSLAGRLILRLLLQLLLQELLKVEIAIRLAEHRLRYRLRQLNQVLAHLRLVLFLTDARLILFRSHALEAQVLIIMLLLTVHKVIIRSVSAHLRVKLCLGRAWVCKCLVIVLLEEILIFVNLVELVSLQSIWQRAVSSRVALLQQVKAVLLGEHGVIHAL